MGSSLPRSVGVAGSPTPVVRVAFLRNSVDLVRTQQQSLFGVRKPGLGVVVEFRKVYSELELVLVDISAA